MIAKMKSNKSLGATIGYNLKEESQIIDAHNLVGTTIDDYKKQMELTQDLFDGRAKNLTAHIILSPSIEDGRKLTDNEWKEIANSFLEKTKLEKNESVVFLHQDKEHRHLHIVANRINEQGKIYRNGSELHMSQRVGNEIAAERGLKQAKEIMRERQQKSETDLSIGSVNKIRQDLKAAANEVKKDNGRFERWSYFQAIKKAGYEVKLFFNNLKKKAVELFKTQKEEMSNVTGYGVKKDEQYYSASKLGKDFTLKSLESIEVSKQQVVHDFDVVSKQQYKNSEEYLSALSSMGYEISLHKKETGEVRGYSVTKDGQTYNASDIGRQYSIKQLEKTGVIKTETTKTKKTMEKEHVSKQERKEASSIESMRQSLAEKQKRETEEKTARDLKEEIAKDLRELLKQKYRDQEEYFNQLKKAGYDVHVHKQKNSEEARGYAIEKDGQSFNSSEIGREFSLKELEKSGVIEKDLDKKESQQKQEDQDITY